MKDFFGKAYSPAGKIIIHVDRLMEEFARRDDGSISTIRQDTRFDNHNKMITDGVVLVGTSEGGREVVCDADMIMPRSSYRPSGYLFSGVFRPEINKGDRVWFHYLCAEIRSFIQPAEGGGFNITMQASDVFCVLPEDKRSNGLRWNFMFCAGKEIIIDDRNATVLSAEGTPIKANIKASEGIELVSGLFTKPMVDEVTMWGISPARVHDVSTEVMPGDRVYLSKDCEFRNTILNEPVWVFKHTDILGLVRRGYENTIPVGPYHLVKVSEKDYSVTQHTKMVKDNITGYTVPMISKTPIIVPPSKGKVIACGKLAKSAAAGEEVLFTRRFTKMLDKTTWLIHDGEIQAAI